MERQMNIGSSRHESFESLRGWMAIWVFVTHFTTMAGFSLEKGQGLGKFLADGRHAVGVFIILSGFLITGIIERQEQSYGKFITRRFFRIFPAYLVFLVLSAMLLKISYETVLSIPWSNSKLIERSEYMKESLENLPVHMAAHVTLLHGVIPDHILKFSDIAIMGVAWSLSLEWQFYLIAPLLYSKKMSRYKLATSAGIIVLLLIGRIYNHSTSYLGNSLILFFMGGASFFVLNAAKKVNPHYVLKLLPIVGFLIVPNRYYVAWFIWITALWAEMGIPIASRIQRYWHSSFMQKLGTYSYSFYCFHFISLVLCSCFILKVWSPASQPTFAVVLLLTSFPIAWIGAYLSYRYIETPGINFAKRITK